MTRPIDAIGWHSDQPEEGEVIPYARTGAIPRPAVSPELIAGEQVAADLVLDERFLLDSPVGDAAVPALLALAATRLLPQGVSLELVRSARGCSVVRVAPVDAEFSAKQVCEFSRGLLQQVPALALNQPGLLMEVRCAERGDEACVYTLLWESALPTTDETAPAPQALTAGSPVIGTNGFDHLTHGQIFAELFPDDEVTPDEPSDPYDYEQDELAASDEDSDELDADDLAHDPLGGDELADEDLGGDAVGGHPGYDEVPGRPDVAAQDFIDELTAETAPSDQADESSAVAPARHFAAPLLSLATRDDPTEFAAGRRHSLLVRRPKIVAPWLWRRAWMVVVLGLVGAMGGLLAGVSTGPSYSAQALIVAKSGATGAGPGSAQEADALAVTDAALLPSDTQLLSVVATELGLPETTVAKGVSATAETGTAVIQINFTASTEAAAVQGARLIASFATATHQVGTGIAARSLAVVSVPTGAKQSHPLSSYSLAIGLVLGLLLGVGLLIAVERNDPRADDASEVMEACGCPVTTFPGGLSAREISAALAVQSAGDEDLTIVPTCGAARGAAKRMHELLSAWWPDTPDGTRPTIRLSEPFESAPWQLAEDRGSAIVVVPEGERIHGLEAVAERLRLLGRAPIFAILCEPDVGSRHRDAS